MNSKLSSRSLIESVEKFMPLFGDIPIGVFITDENCVIVSSNSAPLSRKGVSKADIEKSFVYNRNNRCVDASGNPLPSKNSPIIKAVKEKRSFSNMEIGYRIDENETLWFNLSVSCCGLPGLGVVAAYSEITAIKRIQNELEETWLRYKTLLSGLPDTVIVHRDGKILYSNARIRSFLGYKPYEITRKKISELLADEDPETMNILLSSDKGSGTRCEALFTGADGQKKSALVKSLNITFNDRPAKLLIIEDISKQKRMEQDIARVKQQLIENYSYNSFIGKSKPVANIIKLIPGIASIGCNVLILGESGTGKSMLARMLHESSARNNKPFIEVNCGAIPETLFEAEFFGYVKGAFTDAKLDSKGKFAAASGGTIFLDEISEIPLNLQVKLLKVIEEKRFEPLGSASSQKADVRIIAATNSNLKELVKAGRFREDLFYRLNVVNMKMPPLRQRREDIELLADFFIAQFNQLYFKNVTGITDEFRKFLYEYEFPGNIRELRNMVEHACIFCGDNYIDIADLSEEYRETPAKEYEKNLPSAKKETADSGEELSPGEKAVQDEKKNGIDWPGRLEKFEKELIVEALKKFGQNRAKVMKHLNMSRMTLWRKMKNYGLL